MSSGTEQKTLKKIKKFKEKFRQSGQGLVAPSKEVIEEFAKLGLPLDDFTTEYLTALNNQIDTFQGSKFDFVINLQQRLLRTMSGLSEGKEDGNSSLSWTRGVMGEDFYQDFLKMNAGKEEISGSGQSWTKTISWLESKVLTAQGINDQTLSAIVWACIMVSDKPVLYLVNGKTGASQKGDGIKWDARMTAYLPELTVEELASYDDESEQRFTAARDKYMVQEFRNMNISMCRRIAFVALEYLQNCDFVPVQAWYSKYKARPSMLTHASLMKLGLTNKTTRYPDGVDSYGKPVKGTLDIKVEQIHKFAKDMHHWQNKPAFERLFRGMGTR